MNVRSLRFRLAVWYFCTVTAILSLAVTGYWFAVRAGLHDAMDTHLGYRVTGFREYLEIAGTAEDREIASRLAGISRIGELYEIYDEAGALIAQSYTLSRHRMEPRPPLDLGSEIRFETGGPAASPSGLRGRRRPSPDAPSSWPRRIRWRSTRACSRRLPRRCSFPHR